MTDFLRRLVKEKPLSIIAGVVIVLLMLVAIFADVLAPFPHDEVNIVDRMQAPSGRYLLGTDQLGRDRMSISRRQRRSAAPGREPSSATSCPTSPLR